MINALCSDALKSLMERFGPVAEARECTPREVTLKCCRSTEGGVEGEHPGSVSSGELLGNVLFLSP